MNGLDFCSILQGPTITKVNAILRNIDIFHKKRQRLSYTHRGLVQKPHQEPITLVGTGIEQLLNLVFSDG